MPMAGNIVAKVLADEPSRVQADAIMKRLPTTAACMLMEHRTALLAVADALCEHDELTGEQVYGLISGVAAH